MSVFVDTSAIYAVLDRSDENHVRAARQWKKLLEADEVLVLTNYIQLEVVALVQHRLGMRAVADFFNDMMPVMTLHWLDAGAHESAVAGMLAANRRGLSLVDCSSFVAMRQLGLDTVFCFDRHFRTQGFKCIPRA